MNDHDNDRRLRSPLPEKLIPNEWRDGKVHQEAPPRAPLRAIQAKGDALRAAIRNAPTPWTARTFMNA